MSSIFNPAAAATPLTQTFRGLHLRTHPDSDSAANKVALLALDEVVMSDGAKYSGLTLPLVADITASGAGGLDTGARTASKWYEAHLVGKSSTKAVSDLRVLLHRAKEYVLDQSATSAATTYDLNAAGGGTQQIAQGFKTTNSGSVESIEWMLTRVGAPSGRVWIEIRPDNAGTPSSTVLATSDKLDASKVVTSAQALRFIFRAPASVTAGTQYYSVLRCDYGASGTDKLVYSGSTTSVYANGSLLTYNGSIWSNNPTLDAWFKLYVAIPSAALTFPAGYDESCKLGYVYNSGSNVLVPFVAVDRKVVQGGTMGGVTATIPTLIDWSAVLPPTRVLANCNYYNSSASYTTIAGVPEGYAAINGGIRASGLELSFVPSNNYHTAGGSVSTEVQAVYVSVGGGTGTFVLSDYTW